MIEHIHTPTQTMPLSWLPPQLRQFLKHLLPKRLRDYARAQALSDEKKRLHNLQRSLEHALAAVSSNGADVFAGDAAVIFDEVKEKITEEHIAYLRILLTALSHKKEGGERAGVQKRFIEETQAASSSLLNCTGWLNINYLCFRNGLIAEAYYPRVKAVERSYQDANTSSAEVILYRRACTAAIDSGDEKRALAHFQAFQAGASEADEIVRLNHYVHSNFHKLNDADGRLQDFASDETFRSLVQGKTIAIVGPAASEEECGSEIDSFDLVIRPNYLGASFMPDASIFGSRVDISYYNSEHSEKIFLSRGTSFFENLKYVALPYTHYPFQQALLQQGKARVFAKNPFFFNGVPNMIQCMLYDILPFGPEKIKVFNTNFYLSKDLYYGKYTSQHRLLLPTLAEHDLLSQLHYVRNLWKTGVVEVDEACAFVLKLNSEEYMIRMNDIHT